jgi:hypothetical protein
MVFETISSFISTIAFGTFGGRSFDLVLNTFVSFHPIEMAGFEITHFTSVFLSIKILSNQ